jgi:hypothetical protein
MLTAKINIFGEIKIGKLSEAENILVRINTRNNPIAPAEDTEKGRF